MQVLDKKPTNEKLVRTTVVQPKTHCDASKTARGKS